MCLTDMPSATHWVSLSGYSFEDTVPVFKNLGLHAGTGNKHAARQEPWEVNSTRGVTEPFSLQGTATSDQVPKEGSSGQRPE